MCTVTVLTTPTGFRLVHSRDEQRVRTPGEPPRAIVLDGRRALAPRDPDAGGTWVAVRDDGLALAIMNVNPVTNPDWRSAKGTRSRGLIIRDLLETIDTDSDDPLAPVADLKPAEYAPFRLIVVRPGRSRALPTIDEWTWSGPQTDSGPHTGQITAGLVRTSPDAPVCWATSGLGDTTVTDRLPLFDEIVRPDPTPHAQDRYHRHAWQERGPQSVLMTRGDARTVSITAVEVGDEYRRMTYTQIADTESEADRPTPLEPEVITLG